MEIIRRNRVITANKLSVRPQKKGHEGVTVACTANIAQRRAMNQDTSVGITENKEVLSAHVLL